MPRSFTLHRPDPAAAVPVIIHVPHASTHIPDHCLDDFALTGDDLQAVVDAMVDRGTDQVALKALEFGAHVFVNNVCRQVVDPERFPADADEPAARWGMGAVYTHTHDDRPLRRGGWTAADREARMEEFYHPYHRAMRELVEELQERFTRPVHILDLHSFPNVPHPYETDREVRPAFCLGHEPRHAPRRWLRWWDELADGFLACGGGTAREQLIAHNRPFAGSFVPQGATPFDFRVNSMMLEINRELLVHVLASTLPSAVRTFGAISRVSEFLKFACGDARAAAPGGARISERAARAVIDEFLRAEFPDALAEGCRIDSIWASDWHWWSIGERFRRDVPAEPVPGPFWKARIARAKRQIILDGPEWTVTVHGGTGEVFASEVA